MSRTVEQRALIAQVAALKLAERKAAKVARPARVQPVAAGQRQPRVHNTGFLAYTRRQPCAVGPVGCGGAVEAAHVRFGRPGAPTGLGIKPDDRWAVPLCHAHHNGGGRDAQHASGERGWWSARGLDPHAIAAANFATYQTEPT